MDSKATGEFITLLRKEKGITQKQLADTLNVTDKAVSRWETGKGLPDVSSLLRLSEIFSVTVNELLYGHKIEKDKIEEVAEANVVVALSDSAAHKKKSKKSIIIISVIAAVSILISAVLGLNVFTTKRLSLEQSEKNFEVYEKALQEIADRYNLECTAAEDINIENQDSYKDFIIAVSSNSSIEIRVINSAYKSDKGVESFSIFYTISGMDSASGYNIPLFVDLVNCVSGKELSADFCMEFLNAPESKYSAEKYGYKKLNGEIIAKQHFLNFFEDWSIRYTLNKYDEGVLVFGGLTKQFKK